MRSCKGITLREQLEVDFKNMAENRLIEKQKKRDLFIDQNLLDPSMSKCMLKGSNG